MSTKCNLCGTEFDLFDEQEGFHIANNPHTIIGYGSMHDGEYCDCKLCCTCFDKIMKSIEFTIDPFIDGNSFYESIINQGGGQ